MAQGERPAILSRGYKRRDRLDGVVVVSDGMRVLADLDRAGDEPLMLARAVPQAVVAVCEERYLAGILAERCLGATVHVLDDGFQHVQLARDLDILVTSPGEIAAGRVLPFGRLREAPSAAARAGFVVVMDAGEDEARTEAWELGISQFAAARRRLAVAGGGHDTGPVLAVAGIGKPDQYFSMLREAGYEVAGSVTFADHHHYTRADVGRIAAAAGQAGTGVVAATAKDAVKLEALAPLPFALRSMPMTLAIDGWERLTACVHEAVVRARTAA